MWGLARKQDARWLCCHSDTPTVTLAGYESVIAGARLPEF
jgi:hypothetical protein